MIKPAGRPGTWCKRCHKDTYPDKEAAVGRALVRLDNGAQPLHAYRCPRRKGWHLTSDLTAPARRQPQRSRA